MPMATQLNALAVNGCGLAGYAYDANGNNVSKTLADGSLASYTYDAANRLTYAQAGSGGITSGTYTIVCQTSGLALDNPSGGGSGTGVDQQASTG